MGLEAALLNKFLASVVLQTGHTQTAGSWHHMFWHKVDTVFSTDMSEPAWHICVIKVLILAIHYVIEPRKYQLKICFKNTNWDGTKQLAVCKAEIKCLQYLSN